MTEKHLTPVILPVPESTDLVEQSQQMNPLTDPEMVQSTPLAAKMQDVLTQPSIDNAESDCVPT